MFARFLRWLRDEERHVIRLEDIPTWRDLYSENKQEFLETLSGMNETLPHEEDPEINQKVSIYGANMTSLQIDGIVRSSDQSLTPMKGSFNLPAKHIVHAVGTENGQSQILENCYKNCLKEMKSHNMKSLAFCCISTGNQGFPNDEAVRIALKTVRVWLEDMKAKNKLDEIDRIIFCLFCEEDAFLYSCWMQKFFPTTHEKSLKLCPLPGFIELTTDPDMVTLDDDPDTMRAKMPCGHVIGPDSMKQYFRDILQKGDFRFACPAHGCDQEWEYFLVRHVACFSDDEMHEFEQRLENNCLTRMQGRQRCPGCKTWCLRDEKAGNCVRCPICTSKRGKKFDFCWVCLKEWKRFFSFGSCGNQGCGGKDKRISTLANCKTKWINLCYQCPIIRACPECGLLTEHLNKCAHVSCINCRWKFCFICLMKTKDGKPQCNFLGTCKVAPRQTALAGNR